MMIDRVAVEKEFLKYINGYDVNNEHIERKIGHSLRVRDINEQLAKGIGMDKEKVELAMLIGLLHDIARFEQRRIYDTFVDSESKDHGAWGVEILENNDYIRNYIDTDKYDNIIKKAIKNHNALRVEEGLNEEETIFCKMIRDADKIDILCEAGEWFWEGKENEIEQEKPSQEVIEEYYKRKLVDHRLKNNQLDKVIGVISFIYDINFQESFKIIKDNDYINKILNRFEFKNEETREQIEKIRKEANEYIETKIK